MDPANPVVEAVYTVGDRIMYAGTRNEAKAMARAAVEEIDLGGAFMIPGFNESHNHMIMYGLALDRIDCRFPGVQSIAQIVELVREKAATTPAGEWIRAQGYDDNKLNEKRHPNRYELDAVAPMHPVMVVNGSGHMCVANSLALKMAGIEADTGDPQGGQIVHDGNGEPTGLVLETAQRLLDPVIPETTVEDMVRALERISDVYSAAGITSSTTAGVNSEEEFAAHQIATERGVNRLRTSLMIGRPLLDVVDALGIKTGFGSDMLRIGAAKFFADGSLIGRTAAMFEPFLEDPRDDNLGLEMMPQEELDRVVQQAHDAGFQVATHAIGDRGIHMVMTAYERALERNPRADARHRIEHCGICRPEFFGRLRENNFIAVSQPIFLPEYGDGFIRHLGEERVLLTYPFRTFLNADIHLVFSSDCPVSAFEPLKGIQAAVAEKTGSGADYVPAEALTTHEAIRCYTVEGAYASFEEDRKGTIKPGYLADFTVLARDPASVPVSEIANIRVCATVIGGEFVYENQE
jgi:predicted amidohydrolase YtcJ